MTKFRNKITGEELNFLQFMILVLDEAKRQFEDNHDKLWDDEPSEEQVELAHEQYKHQLENDWEEIK